MKFSLLTILILFSISCGNREPLSHRGATGYDRAENNSEDQTVANPPTYNPIQDTQTTPIQPAQPTQTPIAPSQSGDTVMIGDSIFAFPLGKKVSKFLSEDGGHRVYDYSESGAVLDPRNGDHIESLPGVVQAILDRRN